MRALDGLRILAALMVCLYHFAGKDGPVAQSWGQSPGQMFPTLSQAAVYGCLGVQFFFVISGFVICMSSWGRSLGDFFRSRVARLYPAYWAAIILVTAAACVLPVVVKPLRSDELLLNLTMLQQPMGADRVLGVCWTLWVELRFYVLFALFVVRRGVTYRRVVTFCCLWTFAGVLARVAQTPLTDELVMRDHAPFFIGGLALYLIHRYGSDLLLWGIVVMSFLLGQRYSVTALWHPGMDGDFHRSPYVIQLIVAAAFLSVAAVALGWLRWANWRWLTVMRRPDLPVLPGARTSRLVRHPDSAPRLGPAPGPDTARRGRLAADPRLADPPVRGEAGRPSPETSHDRPERPVARGIAHGGVSGTRRSGRAAWGRRVTTAVRNRTRLRISSWASPPEGSTQCRCMALIWVRRSHSCRMVTAAAAQDAPRFQARALPKPSDD